MYYKVIISILLFSVILNGVKNLQSVSLCIQILRVAQDDRLGENYLNESVSNLISIIGEIRSYKML